MSRLKGAFILLQQTASLQGHSGNRVTQRGVMVSSVISHYSILRKLGEGGMGEVYMAEDTRLKRKVALKLLPAELTSDAERVRRFEQEAQAASALIHPNIVAVYDIGECEAGRFIVMEMVAGRTLRSMIAEDNSLETLLALGTQMARALSAAHAAGIMHRDIKPDNIMVREDGYVKVLDFGLARLLPSTASGEEAATLAQQTTPGMIMGTVAYMSPEQARGQSVSYPSDIFALGVVLYELAAGRHPFQADTLVGYLHAITLQTPAPPSRLKPGIPAALDSLILRMLEKDASRRPTASEVAQALQALERGGDAARVQPVESETMMLPSVKSSDAPIAEGFWVAVLPFKWRGANAELEALAEGLSEDIVTGLSRFSYLRVIARGSTLRYTSDSGDVRAIGKELGARYVMEGSLRQAGTKLRLAVQLVDATTGAHLWAENYERSFSPEAVFDLQDDLVPRIVSTCADHFGVLARSISEAVRWKDSAQLSPYEALMRGFGYHHRLSPTEHAEAREVLERAVEQAPGNADCWAMLSWVYAHEYGHGFNPRPGSLERALAAARRAVDLAPSNPLAHQTLAVALFFRKETASCLSAAERAMALNPLDASNEAIFLLTFTGDWERGCALIRHAMQLNPHHPGWYRWVLAINEYRQANYHAAAEAAVKANVPEIFWTNMLLAAAYGQLGELGAAREAVQKLLAQKEDFAESARETLGKWFEAQLVEHLIAGLRKAGLGIVAAEEAASPRLAADTSGTDVSPLGTEKKPSITQATSSPTQSIAVLPFTNISADEENEYFCDGLAEELLNALAKIDELKVAARTSTFSFKGKNAAVGEIATALNVKTILEGSVRKFGHRVRITAQLINAADGYHLWSERYDREMKDIFDVQDEITVAVVEALKVKLFGKEQAAILKHHTRNPEAHEFYLRGLSYFGRFTPDGFQKAIESFNRAIAIDARYASAYSGLAVAYTEMSFFSFAPGEWMPKAREAAMRALELDDALGEAHNSLAIIKMYYDWDFIGAESEFGRALGLNPGSALIHMWYGWYLGLMGRFDESFREFRRAQEFDPLSDIINSGMGIIFHWSRQPEHAIEQFRKVLELNPNYSIAYSFLAEVYEQQGDFASAIATIERVQQAASDPHTLSTAGYVYARSGDHHKALEILNKLEKRSNQEYVTALHFAQIYAGLGDNEQALVWLDKAYNERAVWMPFLKGDLKFEPLRSDRRFRELLKKVGFPE
jgi:TolB-like protein/Tfp pilus assembly protein PilF